MGGNPQPPSPRDRWGRTFPGCTGSGGCKVKDAVLRRELREAVVWLTIADRVAKHRLEDIGRAQHGPSSGGEGGGSPTNSDPTGDAALRLDRAAQDRAALEDEIRTIHRLAKGVLGTLTRYEPRPATAKEKRETLLANQRDAGCASCARTEVSRGVVRWEPIYAVRKIDDEETPLCRWCWEWHRASGELPPIRQLEAHHRGQRVSKPVERPPAKNRAVCEFCRGEGEVVDGHGELSPCVCRMRSAS